MRHRHIAIGILFCVALLLGATRVDAQNGTEDLKRMTMQDLLGIEVTTPSRQSEPVSEVPAAIFVITQDDIRRSGATSLPEALRLAPGVQVAQIDGGRWATGVRGFADRLSRAMLVLIDGRAVYSPLFAGTYWEVQDLVLEDVDRIEVIRGPGGTLWGANAVNGIINIITKTAAETQGLLATADAGSYGQRIGALRFGGSARDGSLNYRMYGKGLQREQEYDPSGATASNTTMQQAGARADWAVSERRLFTVQGDVYHERLPETAVTTSYAPPYRSVSQVRAPLSGGNVLARLSGPVGRTASFQLQTYYDRTNRDETPVGEDRDTFDVDFQQTGHQWGRQRLSFGGGYRLTSGRITAVSTSAFGPPTRTDNLFTGFAQDETPFFDDRLRAVAGLKVEHNAYSGVEVQPSGRVLWTVRANHTVVASVTRAVRTPSRVETDYTTTTLVSPSVPSFVRLVPNPAFTPEKLTAYEAGYRVRAMSAVYLTASAFYNRLNDVLSTELVGRYIEGAPPEPTRLILPVMFKNGLHGDSRGGEATADVRPQRWLRLTANYAYLRVLVTPDPGARDVSQERRYEGITPRHQIQGQVAVDLPYRLSVDWIGRRASALPAGAVPAYTTSTVRVGWQATPQIEVAVVGQNLNEATHLEWPGGALIRRTGAVTVTWRQ